MHRKRPLKRHRGLDQHHEYIPKKARQSGILVAKPRKPSVPKRAWFQKTRRRPRATLEERAHIGATAKLGCYACEHDEHPDTPASIHHIREGHGGSQRASNFEVIPLCEGHHQGNLEPKPGERKKIAIHKAPRTFRARYGDEVWILRQVWARLGLDFERMPEIIGHEPPWWQAYKEGRLGLPPDNQEARQALTEQGDAP